MSAITIYGATGMVGHDIAQQAADRGHQVTGVSRSTEPSNTVDGVTYVTGEVADAADVVAKAQDADIVVISVPGPRDGSSVQPIIDAHAALVPGTRRVTGGSEHPFLHCGRRRCDPHRGRDDAARHPRVPGGVQA